MLGELKYSYPQEVYQEVPGEISLALSISGCQLKCKSCHSNETWDKNFGEVLDEESIDNLLKRFKYVTCVLFYGGEWNILKLINIIDYIKSVRPELKICLYTGYELNFFKEEFIKRLDFIKTGKYIEELGGLDNSNTNQKFIILKPKN